MPTWHADLITARTPSLRHADAVVVGAGISGIAATIALKKQGLRRIIVLEKAKGLGGVWWRNRYPGIACDVPSALYSYGFTHNAWSHLFASGAEIRSYLQRIAHDNDVNRHLEFETELLEAVWDEGTAKWRCETSRDELHAQFLILATGNLSTPVVPDIQGRNHFTGLVFHSADWPSDFDPRGRRIAVVGTGASVIQFVPQIQPHAEKIVLLQRTPPWILPKANPALRDGRGRLLGERARRLAVWTGLEILSLAVFSPIVGKTMEAFGRWYLRKSVADPAVRAELTPSYRFGCKRPLQSSDWYQAITSANVDYVPCALAEVREQAVIASDGSVHEVDTLIWGTGFEFADQQIHYHVRGRDGRSLAERWHGSPQAYLGTTVSGYPNAFILLGPNTVSSSNIVGAEAQARYISEALATMRRQGVDTIDVRREVEQAWKDATDTKVSGSVINTGGCKSYYLDNNGKNVGIWPGSLTNQVRRLRRFDLSDYIVNGLAASSAASARSTMKTRIEPALLVQ